MAERYLRIDPSGELSWVPIDRVPYKFDPSIEGLRLDQIYAAIGCYCMEQVRTIIPGIVILIDDSGKVKSPPQPHNELASRLYAGWHYGLDDIVGPALVCAFGPRHPLVSMICFPCSTVSCCSSPWSLVFICLNKAINFFLFAPGPTRSPIRRAA